MKTLTTLLLLFAAIITTAQPLTHRGGTAYPAEMVIATFDDYAPGDQVIGCYTVDDNLYASVIRIARPTKFQITCFGDDNDTPVKTGAATDELPVYVLLRDNKTYELDIIRVKGKWFNEGQLFLTGKEVPVYDNLYYSLCPEWPQKTELDIAGAVRTGFSEPFYKWFTYSQVQPQYVDVLELELATGSGLLRTSRTLNFHKYRFHEDDFKRGYIEILFKATPLPNCPIEETQSRVIKINLN